MSAVRGKRRGPERSLLDMTATEILTTFARDAERHADLADSIAAGCTESQPHVARSALKLAASEREKCADMLTLAWAAELSAAPPPAT